MSMTEHKGWQIESRSYKTDADRWCPRALVSVFELGRPCTHDLRTLVSVTFDTAGDADDFAVKMARMWIEDRENRPRWASGTKRRMTKVIADALDLPRLIRSLRFGAEPFQRHVGAPALARIDRRPHR